MRPCLELKKVPRRGKIIISVVSTCPACMRLGSIPSSPPKLNTPLFNVVVRRHPDPLFPCVKVGFFLSVCRLYITSCLYGHLLFSLDNSRNSS